MRRRGRPGLLGTVGRTAVVAGTATATANAVNRHAQNKAAEKEQAAANEVQEAAPPPVPVAPAPALAPAAAAGDDLVSKLTELAKLRDSGVLSQEEFEQAKALVLNP
jgi:putative oligomerization/nucleic acid binding protein